MNVFLAYWNKEHFGYMNVITPFLSAAGYNVAGICGKKDLAWLPSRSIDDCDFIIVWNGSFGFQRDNISIIKSRIGARLLFAECGWFPGAPISFSGKTMYLDRKGINAESEIRDFRPGPISEQRTEALYKCLQACGPYERSTEKPENFTFVPLQVDSDTNIVSNSRFSNMQEFVHFCEYYINGPIVFKKHPRRRGDELQARRSVIVSDVDTTSLVRNARQVVGINSTVLLESLAIGKKVAACGVGLFTNHNVVLECHSDYGRLNDIDAFEPPRNAINSFLYELVFHRQIQLDSPEDSLRENRVFQEVFIGN